MNILTGASDNSTSFKQGDTTHPWAYLWAQRLANDIHQSPRFVEELENMRTALSWMVAAYYEHLKGRWSEERTKKQIREAEELMQREDLIK